MSIKNLVFLLPLSKYKIYLPALILTFVFSSCKKADLSLITGVYIGFTESEQWSYKELTDNNGNFQGVEETRDALYSPQDTFIVKQVGKDALFRVTAGGDLAPINNFSSHEFSYSEGRREFSVVVISNGVENKRLEFTFDGNGNVRLLYKENQPNDNRPPTGREIVFSGSSE